ncbi:hypothetical protein CWC05_12445 [Pseudoalteromonas ruthenica]|uniref:Acyltransferase MbtK/IucB-like conserved domain-containing protein n=1 Tax=Pseudoalteromonas ruthenica TaxID=151081 RepID=A0A5S3Z453_9GAMM|nr:GNAT family N-acetyltransferase [Pseudoalteromonas ruthenica]TMP86605.1 hypothetical protein CWC05_12445 [Pseudoalteromonas ruthenica]
MTKNTVYTHSHPLLGTLTFRALDLEHDLPLLVQWLHHPQAHFWGATQQSAEEINDSYQALNNDPAQHAFIVEINDKPSALIEVYQPQLLNLEQHLNLQSGDLGMHLLLAPAHLPVHGFSLGVMTSVLHFMFTELDCERVVVEPDAGNHKIHTLNLKAGFSHHKVIQLGDKTALLGTLTRAHFNYLKQLPERFDSSRQSPEKQRITPRLSGRHLDDESWQYANRLLIAKMLSEFYHERIFTYDQDAAGYVLSTLGGHSYHFQAHAMALNHLQVDPQSITKVHLGQHRALDAIAFVLECNDKLGIAQTMLGTYLEELASTLSGFAFKYRNNSLSSAQLAQADFQVIETQMTQGHPSFIANNGRIGFNAQDFHQYTPEAASAFNIVWLACHKHYTTFKSTADYSYEVLIAQELDIAERQRFDAQLGEQGLNPDDYYLFPMHPWQWFNKLVHVYSYHVAQKQIVCLGYSQDKYLPQQSIRTLYNITKPHKCYVKTALSILNMGFMRGLSSAYMKVTPAINQWLFDLVAGDDYLRQCGFIPLREVATLGFDEQYYTHPALGDNPYKKMMAALWRENPRHYMDDDESLATMASLLHIDTQGQSFIGAKIAASGLSPQRWLAHYLQAYMTPLLHCFYQYDLVFMPHGENLILRFKNHIPVGVFIKDIGEEIALLNSDMAIADEISRIKIEVPEEVAVLSILTDVFDCFFRYLAAIMVDAKLVSETTFWRCVAKSIHAYQQAHPELQDKFAKHDLFAPSFPLSCLNRLQLRNNQQMVDIADPASSMQYAGDLHNPLADYADVSERA